MKILFCSSEVVPFAKTGGLADVAGALPQALEAQGYQVKVALPKYRCVQESAGLAKMGKNIDVFLVQGDEYFDRDGLYGDNAGDYPDNLARFTFFCNQIFHLLKKTKFQPDIIHCNDWQTALIPVYLSTKLKDDPFFRNTRAIFTIHNLAYQGLFAKDKFPQTGLAWELFNMHGLEFYGKLNLLKGGLLFSRFITTVSPTYAQEMQTREFGCGLDGVLRERKSDFLGIINGLDYAVWDPAQDQDIFQKYTPANLEAKYLNKTGLQQELNLPQDRQRPLIGMISRLASQKGIELVISALDKMARLNLQFVLLGTGDAKYHQQLERIKQKGYPNISINLRFDPVLAHKIYAGSDLFLMPSYYEPCGLGQLISFKYGTIPIVRKTGGLADTVCDYDPRARRGNGFVFTKFNAEQMLKSITRAIELYCNQPNWRRLMPEVMDYDFSWAASAKKYIHLYQRALFGV